jgi:hypothetical protein
MNLFHLQIAAALAATISLAACVAPPAAPTIPVVPGPNKTFDRFGADQAACQQYAAAQISPAVAAANNQAVGGALLGTALGAGLGAGIGAAAGNAGKGAAIGAASGGALGIIGYSGGAPYGQESLQQQYDIMERLPTRKQRTVMWVWTSSPPQMTMLAPNRCGETAINHVWPCACSKRAGTMSALGT